MATKHKSNCRSPTKPAPRAPRLPPSLPSTTPLMSKLDLPQPQMSFHTNANDQAPASPTGSEITGNSNPVEMEYRSEGSGSGSGDEFSGSLEKIGRREDIMGIKNRRSNPKNSERKKITQTEKDNEKKVWLRGSGGGKARKRAASDFGALRADNASRIFSLERRTCLRNHGRMEMGDQLAVGRSSADDEDANSFVSALETEWDVERRDLALVRSILTRSERLLQDALVSPEHTERAQSTPACSQSDPLLTQTPKREKSKTIGRSHSAPVNGGELQLLLPVPMSDGEVEEFESRWPKVMESEEVIIYKSMRIIPGATVNINQDGIVGERDEVDNEGEEEEAERREWQEEIKMVEEYVTDRKSRQVDTFASALSGEKMKKRARIANFLKRNISLREKGKREVGLTEDVDRDEGNASKSECGKANVRRQRSEPSMIEPAMNQGTKRNARRVHSYPAGPMGSLEASLVDKPMR